MTSLTSENTPSPELQELFWRHSLEVAASRTVLGGAIAILAVSTPLSTDIANVPDDKVLATILLRGVSIAFAVLIMSTGLFAQEWIKRHFREVLLLFFASVVISVSVIGVWAGGIQSLYFAGIIQVQFFFAAFVPVKKRDMLWATVGSLIVYFLALFSLHEQPLDQAFVNVAFSLGIFAVLAVVAHREMENSRFLAFERFEYIEKEKDQAQRRSEDLEVEVNRRTRDLLLSNEALRDSEAELRALARRLVEIRESENARVSRELHDDVGQILATLKISMALHGRDVLEGKSCTESSWLKANDENIALAKAAIDSVRSVAQGLRPAMLDNLGLVGTLDWLSCQFTDRGVFECHLDAEVDDSDFSADFATAIFRIVQEALTNTLRHTKASTVDISIREEGDMLRLVIQDDGGGFSHKDEDERQGLGIVGMEERAAALGAELDIRSGHGGVCVELNAQIQRGKKDESSAC